MVKFIGAVRNLSVNTKYAQTDVENGTGLVPVILYSFLCPSFCLSVCKG